MFNIISKIKSKLIIEVISKKIFLKFKLYYFVNTKFNILSDTETIDKIVFNKTSIARFGDGEFDLIRGKGLKFQRYNRELSNKLSNILYSNDNKCLICIPDFFHKTKKMTQNSKDFARATYIENSSILSKLDSNKEYGNSNISRFYIIYKKRFRDNKHPDKLKCIWHGKKLLVVEGVQSRLGIGNDLFNNAQSIQRILCPAVNAFDYYDEIIEKVINQYNHDLVLIALGPTATVLAYDLANAGIQAIDIGHVDIEYEWFLMNAQSKVDIANKHVNEVSGYLNNDDFNNAEYLSQVLDRID